MKHLSLYLALIAGLSQTQCAHQESLTRAANVALVAAEIGGAVKPKEAKLIRESGALVFRLQAETPDQRIVTLSETAVSYAESIGKLTPEQAAALRAAGTVPVTPPTAVPDKPPTS